MRVLILTRAVSFNCLCSRLPCVSYGGGGRTADSNSIQSVATSWIVVGKGGTLCCTVVEWIPAASVRAVRTLIPFHVRALSVPRIYTWRASCFPAFPTEFCFLKIFRIFLLRGAVVNRTYGTHKNLPAIYFTIFTNNIDIWSYYLWPPVIFLGLQHLCVTTDFLI